MKKKILALVAIAAFVGTGQISAKFRLKGTFGAAARQLRYGNAQLVKLINKSSMPVTLIAHGTSYRTDYTHAYVIQPGKTVTIQENVPKADDRRPNKGIWISSGHGMLYVADYSGQISSREYSFVSSSDVVKGQREIIANQASKFNLTITNQHITTN